MRWLVTGGAGFIGSHLCETLAAQGDDVTIADDFSDAPYPRALKEANIARLRARYSTTVHVQNGDISQRAFLQSCFRDPDAVIHLAGLAGVRPSFERPADYARVNVEGTTALADEILARKIETFVFASSSSVYGNSTPLPAEEDAPAVFPESPYAATKRSAELVSLALCRAAPKLRCAALRFFTVYGPRQRPEMAITLFARAILQGTPITLYGDGSMRRDFTHVDDIVRGILLACRHAQPGFRPYNLGSGHPVTLTFLINAIEEACGKKAVVLRKDKPLGDVDATYADIRRARKELHWEPRIDLKTGLATVVNALQAEP